MKYSRAFYLLILLGILSSAAVCQLRVAEAKIPDCSVSRTKTDRSKTKLISIGVINGRALRLVKPEFPPGAMAVEVRGSVQIEIVIDEAGCVTQADAISGHPLLIVASVNAAKASVFEPVSLSGHPIAIIGVIVYNYRLDSMNWLELGFFGDSYETLTDYLPASFDVERKLLGQSKELPWGEKQKVLAQVRENILADLLSNEKDKWLFETGGYLRAISSGYWSDNTLEALRASLRSQLDHFPIDVSPQLKLMIKELLSLEDSTEIHHKLREIEDRFFGLGK